MEDAGFSVLQFSHEVDNPMVIVTEELHDESSVEMAGAHEDTS